MRWVPQVGTRMLTPEEVAWLRSRLAIHERTYKVFALAWVTLGLTFLIDMPDRIGGALRAGTRDRS